MSDLPAASGTDDLSVLGDRPDDNIQVLQTIEDDTKKFTHEYIGELPDGSGIVTRIYQASRSQYLYSLYTNNVYDPNTPITYSTSAFALCFVQGTRILTTRGEVVVEELEVGDTAVTATGRHRPITWIGQRPLGGDARPMPADQAPIRIRAGAFGHGLPARDLLLSPGHPVLVGADADHEGGVLVPVMCLINGTSIARTACDSLTYWHVELDAHDILLAEGLPAESYIDLGSRPWFSGADGLLFDPDFIAPAMKGRCRPVAVDGPLVEAERARLGAAFAQSLADACSWADEMRYPALSCD